MIWVAICTLTLAILVGGNQPTNRVSIFAPAPEIEQAKVQQIDNQAVINIGEYPQGGKPGEPMLPYKQICLLVPPDADLGTVSTGLASESWEELPGEYEIAAVKPAATWDGDKFIVSWGKDSSEIVEGRDSAIYGRDAYFPGRPVEVVSVSRFRQWKLVELRVWLAMYNPVKKKVRVLQAAEPVLTFEKLPADKAVGLDSAIMPVLPNTEKFETQLRSRIANPQDIETFYGGPAVQGGGPAPDAPGTVPADYVIITTSTIVSSSTQLTNFIAAKQAAGFTVKVVTEGAVQGDFTYVAGGNCDQQADYIRQWLVNYWAGDGIQYVLLIGDPHPSSFSNISVPMKMCWPRRGASSDQESPTDMYFAELSGNWDFDGDTYYGEFNGDYTLGGADKDCELKVGRIPFYGNYTDLDNIFQNCITYDTATTNLGYRRKVLIPAAISNFSPQDNDGDGDATDPGDYLPISWRTFGDSWGEAIRYLASTISFAPYTLYERQGVYIDGSAFPLTACNAAMNNANLLNEWGNRYGFVTWWAHGMPTYSTRMIWTSDGNYPNITGNQSPHLETQWPTFVQSSDFPGWIWYGYYSPAFVAAVSCHNGCPENNNNLGYAMLNSAAAIGTISGTRVTWYNMGSWNTSVGGSYGDNASYGYYTFDRMASYNEDIGTALVYCRSNFGTGWAGGESWMNMLDFNVYGDPSLSLDLPPNAVKWEQPPDVLETGMDIRCDRRDDVNRILADDFRCTSRGSITKVILWGSWLNDIKGVIKKIHLSIHSDNPMGPAGWSEPNELLWSQDFNTAQFTETLYTDISPYYEWWFDPYTGQIVFPGDQKIWQYDINIPYGAFIQRGEPCSPVVYWLDAYAELDPNMSPPEAQFGWKTSSQHWNDDAVYGYEPGPVWNELRYLWPHPQAPNSIDLAFSIWSEPVPKEPLRHLKWSQPPIETDPDAKNATFCGWDEKSFNVDEYSPQGPIKMVADDFRCIGNMPVTSIHWWGSYFDWEYGPGLPPVQPTRWWIGFWSNQPAGPLSYSYPKMLLHSFTVDANRVEIERVGKDEYYGYYPYDICYQYNLKLNPEEVFWQDIYTSQTQGNVFWLSIVAIYQISPDLVTNPWGWKTRPWHWMDDAVTFNLTTLPTSGFILDPSIQTVMPLVDPQWGDSMDVSFELDTDPNYIKWEQDFNGIRTWPHYEDVNSTMDLMEPDNERLVADDWRCTRRTPVTAIVWWGSYIGYRFEACTSTFMPLPVPPNRFRLTIWTDVPAGADPLYSYSHPGESIWEYVAEQYDEVLVGHDKHPEQQPPMRTEPVFRYSVRLPEEQWFSQRDFNEVFWLSIQAIYDINQPNYPWGWTNHQHVFNDDAVQGYWDSGIWRWRELYDQTEASEDMSFVLFIDPSQCSSCADYNRDGIVNFFDYADFADAWLWTGSPGGCDNSDLDCDGDVDWRDVKIFTDQWLGSCP
jgi:hypothetical protein